MAKAAKSQPAEVEIPDRVITKAVKDILDRFANIETARGRYMNAARAERDAMATVYENLAARGIPQKAAKTEIKIVRALEQIKGWVADLENEDRKMVEKLAKAQGDKRQLLLFGELPPIPKPTKAERAEKALTEPPANQEIGEPVGAA